MFSLNIVEKGFFFKNGVGYIWNSLKASRVVYPEDRKSCSAVNLQGIQGCLNRSGRGSSCHHNHLTKNDWKKWIKKNLFKGGKYLEWQSFGLINLIYS